MNIETNKQEKDNKCILSHFISLSISFTRQASLCTRNKHTLLYAQIIFHKYYIWFFFVYLCSSFKTILYKSKLEKQDGFKFRYFVTDKDAIPLKPGKILQNQKRWNTMGNQCIKTSLLTNT